MSVPTITEEQIPVFTPPVRRGWPSVAWCVIALLVVAMVFVLPIFRRKQVQSEKPAVSASQDMVFRMVGKYLVGAYNLFGRSEPRIADNVNSMDAGTPVQRL